MSEDLRELFDRVAGQTYSEEGHSACVTCKRSVAILPLRYAVLGSTPPGEPHLPVPELPKPLAPSDLALSTARYTVRPLRQGFLYLFVQRYGADWTCRPTTAVCANPCGPQTVMASTMAVQCRSSASAWSASLIRKRSPKAVCCSPPIH